MKKSIAQLFKAGLVSGIICFLTACPSSKTLDPSSSILTTPNEISKVLVIPDATLEKGSMPAASNVAGQPSITISNPQMNGISGQDMYLDINYSNVPSSITNIYLQIDGADSYFNIPIKTATRSAGTMSIPIQIPERYELPDCRNSPYSAYALYYNASGTKKVSEITSTSRPCFTSVLPPVAGKGKANIGGTNYDATALCDLNFAPYGKGYAIKVGQNQYVILYNMLQGGNQIGNFRSLSASTSFPQSPFALYTDGSNVYTSVSGSASVKGKVVSTSLRVENIISGGQINITASGNCQ